MNVVTSNPECDRDIPEGRSMVLDSFAAVPGASETGKLLAVCISRGGIPKLPQPDAWLSIEGFVGDGRNHTKHIRPDRAVSLLDMEIIEQLRCEGFAVAPGAIGENLTVSGLNVQCLPPGTLLQVGRTLLRLEEPRKPCYVLDSIDPRLKEVLVGRCGYMASVVRGGLMVPGSRIVPIIT